jgi:hypothetical protein
MKKLFTFMLMLGIIALAMVAQAQVTYTATFSAEDLALESVSAADGNTYTKVTLRESMVQFQKKVSLLFQHDKSILCCLSVRLLTPLF